MNHAGRSILSAWSHRDMTRLFRFCPANCRVWFHSAGSLRYHKRDSWQDCEGDRLAEPQHPRIRQRARHQEARAEGRVDQKRGRGEDVSDRGLEHHRLPLLSRLGMGRLLSCLATPRPRCVMGANFHEVGSHYDRNTVRPRGHVFCTFPRYRLLARWERRRRYGVRADLCSVDSDNRTIGRIARLTAMLESLRLGGF